MPDPTTRAGGEGLANQLKQILDDHIADEADAWDHEERPDLWDQTVEVPVSLVAAVIAALASAGTDRGTQGAAEMREACARWHEERANDHALEAQWPSKKVGVVAGHMALARDHRSYAAEIRDLPLPDPRPRTTDGGEA